MNNEQCIDFFNGMKRRVLIHHFIYHHLVGFIF